jgi:4-amino-4-deoxy-L-arabinose transferase-like glycosyltransferase
VSLLRQSKQEYSSEGLPGEGVAAEPSEARFRAWILTLLAFVGPPLLLLGYYKMMFVGLTSPDAMDYAQIGRNLSSGQGFVTYVLRPLALGSAGGTNPLHQPDVTHGPAFPFLLAIAFGALGAKDSVAALVSGVFYLLTIPVLYQIGKRAFGQNVGVITAAIFAFNAMILAYAISGLHITLYIFLATSLFLTLYNLYARERAQAELIESRSPRALLILAGALTGLLYLTDPIFFWVVPGVAVSLLWMNRSQRVSNLLWFALPLAVLMLPWMARNGALTGNPIFGLRGQEIAMNTQVYPGYLAYRMAPDDFVRGEGLFNAVVKKILLSAGQVIQAFPQVTASWMLAFFLPSLFFRFRNPAANRLRASVMYCFAGIFAGTVLFTLQMPLFVATIPAMLVFAVACLLYLIQMGQLSRNAVIGVAALMTVAVVSPLASNVVLADKTPPLKEARSAALLGQDRVLAKDDIVLSDEPWISAWFANRPSLWLPKNNQKIETYNRRFNGKIKGLLLTERAPGISPEWGFIYSAFQQTNRNFAAYQRAPEGKRPARIPGMRIDAQKIPSNLPDDFKRLLVNLGGFTSVPPLDDSALTTAVAIVPPSK